MSREIKLPKLSEDVDEGKVAEVMVKEGDTIEVEDEIIAVESDKATVEVPSPEAGIVKEIRVSEGDDIRTGDVILLLEEEDADEEENQEEETKEEEDQTEEVKEEAESAGNKDREEKEEEEKKETDEKEQEQEREKEEKAKSEEKENGEKEVEEAAKEEEAEGEVPAAPGARRLAREYGLDLKDLSGSGPDGLITEKDVRKAAGQSKPDEGPKKTGLPDFSKWGETERKPLSEIRKATARQTSQSWQTIPHVTQFDEAYVEDIQNYIEKNKSKTEEKGGKLTITAILVKLVAGALYQFPQFNASIDMENEEVILKKYVHIGIAVDTEDGLMMPVIRDANRKSIIDIAVEITEVAEKARNRELSAEDMEGGNFGVSNLGGIGGTQFTPVIYHPNVAILGASEITVKPVFKDDKFHPRVTLPLSLSYDHRLIDGAAGARFLRFICDAIEDPYKALLGE